MPVSVNLQTVHPRKLAAVRREVVPGAVSSAWGPALGKVWEFLKSQPGLRTDGHNVFLYRHPAQPDGPILVTSASKLRAPLKPQARCTRPKRREGRPPYRS